MSHVPQEVRDRLKQTFLRDFGQYIISIGFADHRVKVTVATPEAVELLPEEAEGYPVDVEVGDIPTPSQCFHAHTDVTTTIRRNRELNPIPSGVDIGGCTTGTVAKRNGENVAVTAAHCVASSISPTEYVNGLGHHSTLAAGPFEGPNITTDNVTIDVATGPIQTDWNTELYGFDEGVGEVVMPSAGEQLSFVGKFTGAASGEIQQVDVFYRVGWGDDQIVSFDAGVQTPSISTQGDSGGLAWVTRNGTNHPVGVTSAGSDDRSLFAGLAQAYDRDGLTQITGRQVASPDGTLRPCEGDTVPPEQVITGGQEGLTLRPE